MKVMYGYCVDVAAVALKAIVYVVEKMRDPVDALLTVLTLVV